MAGAKAEDLDYPSQLVQTLESHTGPVNVVRYNHGAKYALSGGADRHIRLWNPVAGKEIKRYEGHGREVLGLDIAHDNAKFASCGGDKQVLVWDVASGTTLRKLSGHYGKINCVAFNADAQVLVTAGFDAKIMLWDMRASSRDPLQTLKEPLNSITSLSIPATLPHDLIASSLDGTVRSYDLRQGYMTEDLVGAPVHCVVPARGPGAKDTYLSASADGALRVFDRGNGGVLQTMQMPGVGKEGSGWRIRADWGYGDGSVLAGGEDGKVYAWSVLTGKLLDTPNPALHKKAITWLELHPSGKQMITASADGTIKVWTKANKV